MTKQNRRRIVVVGVTVAALLAVLGTRLIPPRKSDGQLQVGQVTDIHPTVEVFAGYNRHISRFWLEYRVGNLSSATNAIAVFATGNIARPEAVYSPPQWMALYGALKDSLVTWSCTDTLTAAPAGWTGGNVVRSPYMIDANDTTHIFQVVTDRPPSVIHFYALGFDTLPGQGSADTWKLSNAWSGQVNISDVGLIGITAVNPSGTPQLLALDQPKPNPTSSSTTISFTLPKEGRVELTLFDVQGARVRRLIEGSRKAGLYATPWDGYDDRGAACKPGVYFCRLVVDGKEVGSRRVTIIR